jgi:hypothetical protein
VREIAPHNTKGDIKMNNNLPDFCYTYNSLSKEVILLINGVKGYKETDKSAQNWIKENEELGITPEQVMAMICGSMFGWNVPGANPDEYPNATWKSAEA